MNERRQRGQVELDARRSGTLEVTLLWSRATGRVSVAVFDSATGDDFELEVDGAHALDALAHPYAYAARYGVACYGAEPIAA